MDKKNIGKRNNTMTNTLINKIGLEQVQAIWIKYGCYKAAEELSKMLNEYISFSTIRYLSQALNWTRPVNPKSAIYKAVVIKKTMTASYYKHLIFPMEGNKNEHYIIPE